MKKRIIILAYIVLMLATLASCIKKSECFFCAETKYGKITKLFGEEIFVCSDCGETIREGF